MRTAARTEATGFLQPDAVQASTGDGGSRAILGYIALACLLLLALGGIYLYQRQSKDPAMRKVAVVLSGSGFADGSEIQEAVFTLLALSRANVEVQAFAPEIKQMHVINHYKGAPQEGAQRQVLEEAARIVRGNIKPLAELRAGDYNGLVIVGGFGVAKNLSNYATAGKQMEVLPEMVKVIKDFHQSKKPIAAMCMGPTLLARTIPGARVTLGSRVAGKKYPYAETVVNIESWGTKHVEAPGVHDVVVDPKNKFYSAQAYMTDGLSVAQIEENIRTLIDRFLRNRL